MCKTARVDAYNFSFGSTLVERLINSFSFYYFLLTNTRRIPREFCAFPHLANFNFGICVINPVLLIIKSHCFRFVSLISRSETISTEVFHLVQTQMDHYYEMMLTDKKRIPFWSHRLHLALKAYQVDDRVIMSIAGEYREEMTKMYHVF